MTAMFEVLESLAEILPPIVMAFLPLVGYLVVVAMTGDKDDATLVALIVTAQNMATALRRQPK